MLYSRFESICRQYPQKVAIVFKGEQVTYQGLYDYMEHVCSLILNKVNQPMHETPIGFCINRGWKMVAVMFAIMKVGGCYVPFDASYPMERLMHILRDVKPALVIIDDGTPSEFLQQLELSQTQMTTILDDGVAVPSIDAVQHSNQLSSLAYIIYTSGSSGKPKGVMIEQHSIVNIMESGSKLCHVTCDSRILSYVSVGFDAAGWDIYLSILNGATLYMAEDEICLSPADIHEFIDRNRITMATVTPAFLALMPKRDLPSLSVLIVMGDMADSKNMEFWCDDTRIVFNGYGPTETTIGATLHVFNNGDRASVIGRPFDGYELYIFDELMQSCNEGELYIGGHGLARGYHGMEEQTKQKFIETPYGRLYKTGDLVKWNSDGELEFVGRVDNQVKIRGVRIEIEEIESLINKLSWVEQCAVRCFTHTTSHQKYLVVYYACSTNASIDGQQIRVHLQEHLHPAVVPSHYIRVPQLPMNAHGKIDRLALSSPTDMSGNNNNHSHESPKSQLEAIIVNIFERVLQMDGLGRDAHFLELGGHSMLAQMVASLLSKEGFKVSVTDILRRPVVLELADYVKPNMEAMSTTNDDDSTYVLKPLPLTPTQLEVWNHQQMDVRNPMYNMPSVFSIRGQLDIDALGTVLSTVFNQHFALRCSIRVNHGDQLLQIPEHEFQYKLNPHVVHSDSISEEVRRIVQCPLSLHDGPLVRVELLRNDLDEQHHVLVIVTHGIVTDSFSEQLLNETVSTLYSTTITQKCESSSVVLQNDFANYERFVLSQFSDVGLTNEKDVTYWSNYLKDFVPTVLKGDREQAGGLRTKKTIDIGARLQATSSMLHCTPYSIMLTALNLLLMTYTGQMDIAVGVEVALRNEPYVSETVGLLVSPIIARNKMDSSMTLEQLVRQVTENTYESMDHTRVAFRDILTICKQFSEVHPTNLMFVMQNVSHDSKLVLSGSTVERVHVHHNSNMFPMCWNVYLDDTIVTIDIEHSHNYSSEFVNAMLCNYVHILHQVLDRQNHCAPLCELSMLSKEELRSINKFGSGSEVMGGSEMLSLTSELNQRALESPDFIAVKYSTPYGSCLDGSLTYSELNGMSNRLAHTLINRFNVQPGDRVGLCMNRSCEMVITMLAILKAGACYVPMDPTYPAHRLNHMIGDSRATLIITTRKSSVKLLEEGDEENSSSHQPRKLRMMVIDDLLPLETAWKEHNIDRSTPDSVAYIIYTSGSTGTPKACVIKHRSVLNVVRYFSKRLELKASDKVWNLTSISFDIMALEVFMPLIFGCQLMVCPACVAANPVDLVHWINTEKPTVLQATPTMFSLIGEHVQSNNDMTILVGGESLTSKVCRTLLTITPRVYNVYGPSETTIWSLCTKVESSDTITIGSPISNTSCYVVDEHMRLVPRGCPGELVIGGAGVADGYWMRDELTKQKFVTVPFNDMSVVYRTGDVVKLNLEGQFEFLGRKDFQVKIRGHRIEVNEIVSTIESHPCVKRAVVLTRGILHDEQQQQHLVAYYVSNNGAELSDIRSHIASRLPSWMMPSFIIHMHKFPETLNGKVDVNQLPSPHERFDKATLSTQQYSEPETEDHWKMCHIWTLILHMDQISIDESFINLGATSLNFPVFVNMIQKTFGKRITIEQLIKHSTIRQLVKLVTS